MLTSLFLAMVTPQSPPTVKPKWVLTFAQEFDGKAGTAPDRKIWSRDTGGGGYGNNELQSYTEGNKNAFLDGKGNLIIEARKEKTTGEDNITRDYSSARLKTNASFTQTYGKFEARLKMPKGKGIWPAFWMLGDNISKVGWPGCGEIDIMEYLGHQTKKVHGTIHGPGYSGGGGVTSSIDTPVDLSEDFHVYGIEWEPEEIRFYFDGKVYQTASPKDIGPNDWVYDHPHFIILNLAIGGGFPGNPDATTTFPQQFAIDYIRVYKDEHLVVDTEGIRKRAEFRKTHGPVYTWPGPFKIEGTINFADYNLGGPEVAYHDTDPQNNGGKYRLNEGVDVGASGIGSPKNSVGWTKAGEWMAYDIVVSETGKYITEVLMASEGDGGDFHLEIDGKPVSDNITVPNTGGWTNWKAFSGGTVNLTKGKHVLKVKMDKDGKTGSIGNLASITFKKA
jgi:beta-glucanase (GH16 family)